MKNKKEFLWQLYLVVNDWIKFADTKATALLAANGIIAGVVLINLNHIIPFTLCRGWCLVMVILSILAFLASIVLSLRCVMPKLKVGEPKSAFYFDHIAQLSIIDYEAKAKAILSNEDDVESHIIYQIWANSKVASAKHRNIALSIWSLIIGIILSLVPLTAYFWINA